MGFIAHQYPGRRTSQIEGCSPSCVLVDAEPIYGTFRHPNEKHHPKVVVQVFDLFGAPGWDRTSNPCLRRAVLYPLSYGRIVERDSRACHHLNRPCVREQNSPSLG
jgi:hypothetical protein